MRTAYEKSTPSPLTVDHSLTDARQGVFWLEDLGEHARYNTLTSSTSCDLVIVGGGYSGLWAALLAKERMPDARIIVLEARSIGWAASGRNGGFCEFSLTHGDANGHTRWPEENARLTELGIKNLDGIEATLTRGDIDAEFERTGVFEVATEEHQIEWMRESAASHAAHGSVFMDESTIQAEVASPLYRAAAFFPKNAAMVHPAKLAVGLAAYAAELGIEIFENSPARSIIDASDGVEVVATNGAVVSANKAVLATNVFPSLLKRNRLMTLPVYDYVLMTEPLTAEQRAEIGWAGRQGIGDSANQFHYSRLTRDGRILYGGYDAITHYGGRVRAEYENRPASFERLASHFFATYPQLEGLKFSHRWAGAIDSCTRFCAFMGTARKGRIAYTAGFTGLGVAATRFAAEVCLDLLDAAETGQQTELTQLRMVREKPLPFPPEPIATLGVGAVRWSMDRADHRQGSRNLLLRGLDAVGLGFDS